MNKNDTNISIGRTAIPACSRGTDRDVRPTVNNTRGGNEYPVGEGLRALPHVGNDVIARRAKPDAAISYLIDEIASPAARNDGIVALKNAIAAPTSPTVAVGNRIDAVGNRKVALGNVIDALFSHIDALLSNKISLGSAIDALLSNKDAAGSAIDALLYRIDAVMSSDDALGNRFAVVNGTNDRVNRINNLINRGGFCYVNR